MEEPIISTDRITIDPLILGGAPCVRGLPVAVRSLVGMIADGIAPDEILAEYPYLEREDISAALAYNEQIERNTNRDGSIATRKPRPNHQRTLNILRSMEPRQKLAQVFKLNDRMLELFRAGLRRRFPDLDDAEFEKVYLQMRERCHNRIY
jgi:uncharacterized protein (DUF433 family)